MTDLLPHAGDLCPACNREIDIDHHGYAYCPSCGWDADTTRAIAEDRDAENFRLMADAYDDVHGPDPID